MVRITPGIMARVELVAKRSGLKPASLARMGLLEVVDRLSAEAPEMDPEEAKAVAAARARGLNVRQVLTDALEAKLMAEAAA